MKKLLTLLLAVCMLATICVVPAMAAFGDFKNLYKNYELGESSITETFDETVPTGFTTKDSNAPAIIDSGALKISKVAGISANVETRPNESVYGEPIDNMSESGSKRCLFSFKFKIHLAEGVKFSITLGPSVSSKKHDVKIVLTNNTLEYTDGGTSNGTGEGDKKTITCSYVQSDSEWTKLNILTDSENKKYYVWLGESTYDEALSDEILVDGADFCENKTAGYMSAVRIWLETIKAKEAALWIDDYSVTPLKARNQALNDAEVAVACVNAENIINEGNFKTAADLGVEGAEYTVSKEGLYSKGNIVFPLFDDTADVTLEITAGGNTATRTFNNIAFPSGYTTIESATATENTVTIPVTLRNTASARVDELLVIAAVYDKATKTLIASNPCILEGNTFVAEFDKDVSGDNYEVRGFVWQKGTLRPVK